MNSGFEELDCLIIPFIRASSLSGLNISSPDLALIIFLAKFDLSSINSKSLESIISIFCLNFSSF